MSEYEDRPAVDVEREKFLSMLATSLDEYTLAAGKPLLVSPGGDIRALLDEHAALVEEVERLRGADDTAAMRWGMVEAQRAISAALANERDEAIERATKAESQVRTTSNALTLMHDSHRREQDARQSAEQVIADVRELVRTWPTGDNGQDYRRAVTQCANALLALLPDETGDDRG